jgi:adenine-specific DNA methylase
MSKQTVAQKRILDILSDGKFHILLLELKDMGFWNQHPAIKALERKGKIKVVEELGYYTIWSII